MGRRGVATHGWKRAVPPTADRGEIFMRVKASRRRAAVSYRATVEINFTVVKREGTRRETARGRRTAGGREEEERNVR